VTNPVSWVVVGQAVLGEKAFCKRASDALEPDGSQILLLIDPAHGLEYWESNGFGEMAAWAKAGFPGPCHISHGHEGSTVWILSPDPGKEIGGDS
jgi:hypothetical protein